jgi:hypothetical protein
MPMRTPIRHPLSLASVLPMAALLMAAILAASACGKKTTTEPGGSATLSGTVTDTKTGAGVPAARVSTQGKSTTTGASGAYSLSDLAPGSATVVVEHQGHDTASVSATLTNGAATTTNVALTPAFSASLAGTYSGTWKNNTFGSQGTAGLTISADTIAQTFQSSLTLGGTVFGLGNAPALPINGSYSVSGGAANVTSSSAFYGSVALNVSTSGQITGSFVSPMGGVVRVDFSGTAAPAAINVNYTVTLAGGNVAAGTLTLTR